MRLRFLAGLAVGAWPVAVPAAPEAIWIGSYHWQGGTALSGGFSGLDVAADGGDFLALSDAGATVAGRFIRDPAGRITGIDAEAPIRLRDSKGKALAQPLDDAEGLSFLPGGGFAVSFEIDNRVSLYVDRRAAARPLTTPRAFHGFTLNAGPEMLATAADGTVYTMPERPPGDGSFYPVYRYRGGAWTQPFAIPRDGTWSAVGGDFGPDGRLYLLERDFWGLIGFMSRVRRFTLGDTGIVAAETLLETRADRHDNLEGLAVWRDPGGAIRLTMVSDDNFRWLQRTEIVEYRIAE